MAKELNLRKARQRKKSIGIDIPCVQKNKTSKPTLAQRAGFEIGTAIGSLLIILIAFILVGVLLPTVQFYGLVLTAAIFVFFWHFTRGLVSTELTAEAISVRGKLTTNCVVYIFFTTVGTVGDLSNFIPSDQNFTEPVIKGTLGLLTAYFVIVYSTIIFGSGFKKSEEIRKLERDDALKIFIEEGEGDYEKKGPFIYGFQKSMWSEATDYLIMVQELLSGGAVKFTFDLLRNLIIPFGLAFLVLHHSNAELFTMFDKINKQVLEMSHEAFDDWHKVLNYFKQPQNTGDHAP